jgi:hypothetical protein
MLISMRFAADACGGRQQDHLLLCGRVLRVQDRGRNGAMSFGLDRVRLDLRAFAGPAREIGKCRVRFLEGQVE